MRAALQRLSTLKDSEIMATKVGWEKKVEDLMSQVKYLKFSYNNMVAVLRQVHLQN